MQFNIVNSIVFLVMVIKLSAGDCSTDNFAPCSCYNDSTTSALTGVVCNRVPVKTVNAIFKKVKTYYIDQLTLTPCKEDDEIVANVIGNHAVGTLSINCPDRFDKLKINAAAFSQTKKTTDTLKIQNCDLSKLNWAFLNGFSNLTTLEITFSSKFHTQFFTFPSASLTSLTTIEFKSVMDLNEFSKESVKLPPFLSNGLEVLDIEYCYDLGDAAIERFLSKWIVPSSSKTLTTLSLAGNTLSKIPLAISKLKSVYYIEFWENLHPWSLNAFSWPAPVQFIFSDDSTINSVACGTFKGNFSDAQVSLYNNNLTTFESCAFKSMLEQMSASTGYLEVGGNPFDCSIKNQCGLGWLIRDNPNYLNSMWSARCSNGTFFFQLDPKALKTPSGKPC